MTKPTICVLWVLFTVAAFLAPMAGVAAEWPTISDFCEHAHFDETNRGYTGTITGRDGKPLYRIEARFPDGREKNADYDFSGVFDCRLYPASPQSSACPTLLQNRRNASRDWQTDGRFLDRDLLGLVGVDATRVLVQRSRLRGMVFVIEIGKVMTNPKSGDISGFNVVFRATNDPAAVSDIAASVKEAD